MPADDVAIPLRVLLLEDAPDDAALIDSELERAGYAVHAQVVDTRDAFVAHLHPEIDVILSDHALPQFNALQALDIVQREGLDIPFIIVSGVIEEEKAVAAMRRGAADYLLKDRLARLGPAVQQALKEKQLRMEKERASEAIRTSEARYRLLAEHATDVICRIAMDGTFLYVSPSCEGLLGYEPEELIGRDAFALVHPEDADALRDGLVRIGEQPFEPRVTYRVRRKVGLYVWIESNSTLILDGESKDPQEIVAVLRDVSERKQYESALLEAKERAEEMVRLKDAFLANMSHEIRTPLTGIIGFADLLGDEVSEANREAVEIIQKSGRRLMDTLTSVLDLARLESGTMELQVKPVRLVERVHAAVDMFRVQARVKGLRLDVRAPDEGLTVEADRTALDRVLSNLLSNAIKFTAEGGVTVTVSATEEHVEVAVSDSGVGIGESFLPRLFEAFYQESSGLNRDYEGSGLGLAITKQLVDLMRGEIEVESARGRGSTFRLRLPRVADEAGAAPVWISGPLSRPQRPAQRPDHAVARPTPRRRILVVEDNEATRQFFRRLLERTHEVEFAATVSAALALARQATFDVVFLDINLGGGQSGEDVLHELRRMRTYRSTPVVAVTAHALPQDRERFLEAGFDAYLSKPFTSRHLEQVLETAGRIRSRSAGGKAGVARGGREAHMLEDLLSSCQAYGLIDDYEWDGERVKLAIDIASYRLSLEDARVVLLNLLQQRSAEGGTRAARPEGVG